MSGDEDVELVMLSRLLSLRLAEMSMSIGTLGVSAVKDDDLNEELIWVLLSLLPHLVLLVERL